VTIIIQLRVLCLAPYTSLGASNRLRFEQYIGPLREHGIDLRMAPFLDAAAHRELYAPGRTVQKALGVLRGVIRRARDLWRARRFDLVVVHRESSPIGPPLVERWLSAMGIPFVYDFDDAVYLGPIAEANRRWSWLRHPSRVAESTRRAARVIVGNDYLARWAKTHNPDVWIIPTGVDTERHRPRATEDRTGPVVIGWIGSVTTAPYLRLLDRAFDLLAEEQLPIVFRVIDAQYAHPRIPVQLRAFDHSTEPQEVADFDIGVLPQPDDAWTRGKGAFKALLYMASGVPVVASRVGVNPVVIPHGEVGYCVDTDEEWAAALARLVRDPALRARLGAAGRQHVERTYSVRVQTPRLAEALLGATPPRAR
jgi:glycosyltransferase involved in cell wall biosynthesis